VKLGRVVKDPERPGAGAFVPPNIVAAARPSTAPDPTSLKAPDWRERFTEAKRHIFGGRPQEALRILAALAAEVPREPEVRFSYGQVLAATGDLEGATREYRAAVELAPTEVPYLADYAKTLALRSQLPEAIDAYERLNQLAPDSPGYLRQLANLYKRQNDDAKALPYLTRAAELRFNDLQLQQELAVCLEKVGQPTKAAEVYRKILQWDPADESTRALLSERMFQDGQSDDAIALVREGIDHMPGVAGLHRDLGSLYERTGRMSEAATEYREYARLAPTAADATAISERANQLDRRAGSGGEKTS
jgi:Flp pilus assembly protein TadD